MFVLEPAEEPRGSAPAELFTVDGGPHTVGVIASVTRPFCGDCDRVRLTADGQVRNCLFAREESDLRGALRGGADDAEIADRWQAAMLTKRPGHGIDDVIVPAAQPPDVGHRRLTAAAGAGRHGPARECRRRGWQNDRPCDCLLPSSRRAPVLDEVRAVVDSVAVPARTAAGAASAGLSRPARRARPPSSRSRRNDELTPPPVDRMYLPLTGFGNVTLGDSVHLAKALRTEARTWAPPDAAPRRRHRPGVQGRRVGVGEARRRHRRA